MRRIVCLILIIIAFAYSLRAQQKKGHQSLLYTSERIRAVKQRMANEPNMAGAWKQIKDKADARIKTGGLNDMDNLSLAYLMTEDKVYSDKIKDILLNAIKAETWGSTEMLARIPVWTADLGLAHKAYMSAIGYDAIYNTLSSSEKRRIAEGLKRLGMDPCLNDWVMEPARIHSLNSMGHNWWTSCVCMGGILALSLQNELPEAREGADFINEILPEWFSFAGDVLQQKPKTFDETGGMYESLNYANFGIQEALQFRLAWKNKNPGKQQPEIPELKNIPNYFIHVCYPRTGILYDLNFGDSHQNITAESTMMLLYAMGVKSDDMLWYISQVQQGQHRDGYFINRPMGFLYTPDLRNAPKIPDMKKSQLFSDFGWATMRTSWNKDATMLAVKSGYTWNHSHADANSFILFHNGVDILKDDGHCWYPNANYRNYFFQSEAHNVVLFNGKGQPREQQYHGSTLRGNLHYLMDAGNMKYVLANGTGPYSDQFSRNFRHFLWMDNVIYIIDDLKTHKNGHFQWLWHYNGTAEKRSIDLNVTDGNSAVAVRPLYPRMLAKSDFVHDYPDDLYWEQVEVPTEDLKGKQNYYSFHLPAKVDRVKGVTAIIIKDSVNQKRLPVMERREGKDWIGLRIRNKGKVTNIYINQLADGRLMHSNSWIEADGWWTDAYMFAVTYKEGQKAQSADEMFICYGSALKRGEDSYFSSLSKLFVMTKRSNNKMDILIEGQPKVHAVFGKMNKPTSLKLNGKGVTPFYKVSRLIVKY